MITIDEKIKGITVEIGGNTTGLAQALSSITKDANSLQSELRNINKILKESPDNEIINTQKFELLNKAVEEAANKLNALWQAQDEVEKKFKSGEISADAYRNFQQELAKAQNGLKSAQNAIDNFSNEADQGGQNTKNLKNEVVDLGKSSDNTGDKFKNLGNAVSSVGKVIGNAASVIAKTTAALVTATATAVSGAIKESIEAGIEFESAFAGVKKTVDATDEQLLRLEDDIRNMAMTIPATTTEIAAVAEAAGQLGIGVDDINEFTRVMIDLGESTNLSSTEAASALAKLANITKLPASEYSNLGSVIVALGNNFATTESDIVNMATRLASTGEIVGLSESQIMAVSTALSAVGIEAEAGGSAISKVFKNIELAVATGSSELDQYASIAGLSAEEFAAAWGDDAVSALSSFIDGLNDTERNGMSAIQILDEMGLTEVRMSNAILALSSSQGILNDAVTLANDAWNENTALSNEAAQRYETMESKVQVLKNGLNDLGLSMYESLEEPLKTVVGNASGYIQQLSTALKEDGLAGLADTAGRIIGDIITQITDNLPSLIETSISILETIGSTIKDNLPMVTESALNIMMMLIDTITENLPDIIDTAINIISTLATGLMDKLPEIADSAMGIITTIIKAIIDGLPELFDSALVIIMSLVNGITDSLPELIPAAIDALLTIIEGLLDNLDLLIDCALQLIVALADGLITALPKLIDKIPTIIAKLVEALIKSYPKIVKAGQDLLVKLIQGALSIFPKLVTLGQDIGKKIGDTLRNIDWVQLGKDMLNGIFKGLSAIGNAVKDFGNNLLGGIKDFFGIKSPSKLFEDEIGKNMGLGVISGYVKAIDKNKDKMYKAIPTDMGADINIAMRRVNNISSINQEYQLVIPVDIGGNKFTKIVSKLQYDMNQGKLRVAGVSVR